MARHRNPGGDVGLVAFLALVAGGAIGVAIYFANRKPQVVAQPGGQVTSLTQGYTYTLIAAVPSGITDPATLMQSLASAGWNNVSILYFGPTNLGGVPQGLTADASSYVAVGVWNGANGTTLPQGLTAYSGDFTPPGATPVATNAGSS